MSQKITGKNLSYDTALPPFLAALKAQAAGRSGPDPLLAGRGRSTKKRSSSEEAEDVPLVLDEDGNAVNVDIDKDGVVTRKDADEPEDEAAEDASTEKKQEVENKASIGGRKRKVARVIGDTADESAEQSSDKKEKDDEPPKDKKPKKKAKKIKLSFDEEAG